MTPGLNALLVHLWESSWFALLCVTLILGLDRLRCPRARHFIAWLGLLKFLLPLAWITHLANPAEWDLFRSETPEALTLALNLDTWTRLPDANLVESGWGPWLIGMAILWLGGFLTLSCLLIRRIHFLRVQLLENSTAASAIWQADATRLWRSSAALPHLRFARSTYLPAGVFGWLNPVVIIPPDLQTKFDAAEREAFLRHEFQHLYKHDPLWLLVQINLRNLLWMHPLLWWLEHRIRTERELMRDQEVIHKTQNPESYLSCLMKASKIELNEPRATSVCLNGSPFARRVKAIARAGRSGVASILSTSVSFVALGAFALFLCAAQVPAIAGDKYSDNDQDHRERMNAEVSHALRDLEMEVEELHGAVRNISKKLEKSYTKDNPGRETLNYQREMQEKLGRYKERLENKQRRLRGMRSEYSDYIVEREEGEDRDARDDQRSERNRDRDRKEGSDDDEPSSSKGRF